MMISLVFIFCTSGVRDRHGVMHYYGARRVRGYHVLRAHRAHDHFSDHYPTLYLLFYTLGTPRTRLLL